MPELLGEAGRPSYAAVDFALPASRRLVAGVHLERKGTAAYRALNARILERMAALLALLDRDDCEALFGILERLGAGPGRAAAPER